MSIKTKLLVYLFAIFINIVLIVVFAVYNGLHTKDTVQRMMSETYHKIDVANDTRVVLLSLNKLVSDSIYVLDAKSKGYKKAVLKIKSLKDAFPVMLLDVQTNVDLSTVIGESVVKVNSAYNDYNAQLEQIISVLSAKDIESAKQLYSADYGKNMDDMTKGVDDLVFQLKASLDQEVVDINNWFELALFSYAVLILIALATFFFIYWRNKKDVLRPLNEISSYLERVVATGEFSQRYQFDLKKDEIGVMTESMNHLLLSLENALGEADRKSVV